MLVTTRGEDIKWSLLRGGIPIELAKPHHDKQEENKIFTTQECIKMQRDMTRTQGKSFHGATKEIT